jgi:Ca-activated chloride channel family protein
MYGSAARLWFALFIIALGVVPPVAAQAPLEQPVFRAGVDLVSIAAVVRDKHGRLVSSLTRDDFEVLDGGERKDVVDFQSDSNAPISVALLVDGSGSMPRDAVLVHRLGERLLAQLDAQRDDAALMSFDTRLLNLREFTSNFDDLRSGFKEIDAFGATSVYDAIAGASGIVARQTQKRRALLVVTDGSDNASQYTPDEVAWIASTIDVPVYVLAVGAAAPLPAEQKHSGGGDLAALARATGGDYFAADTETRQQIALGRVIEELRHQYLIAFEPARVATPRPLEIRMRNTAWRVRARQWYAAASGD